MPASQRIFSQHPKPKRTIHVYLLIKPYESPHPAWHVYPKGAPSSLCRNLQWGGAKILQLTDNELTWPQIIFINHVRAQLQHNKLGKRPASSHHVEVQAGNSQGLRQSMGTAQRNYDGTAGKAWELYKLPVSSAHFY